MAGSTTPQSTNPLTYITPDDAPFLIVHGTADKTVSPRQSEALQIALKKAGVENTLEYVPGTAHSMRQVQTPAVAEMVTTFFDKHLRGNQHQRDDVALIGEPSDSWEDPFADELPGAQYKLFATPTRGLINGKIPRASYRIYLPPGYDLPQNARLRYPVIYDLHSLNDDSRKWVLSGYTSRADVAIRTGLMPPAIIISVQALNQANYADSPDGRFPVESVIIKDLIPHVDKTYRTIATRAARAIEGHSMGGAGSLHLGFKYPELFGTVSAFSPAVFTKEEYGGRANEERLKTMYGGDLDRYDAEGGWSQVRKNAAKIRGRTHIRLVIGDQDTLGLPRTRWIASILTELNIAHEYIEVKGAPHPVKEVLSRLESNPFEFYGKAFAQFK